MAGIQGLFSAFRVVCAVVLSSLLALTFLSAQASAHEVQPAIADLTIGEDEVSLELRMTLESAVAGLNLDGLFDTNEAENAAEYDRLRELDPVSLDNAFRSYFPTMSEKMTLNAGGTVLDPQIAEVEIPEVGNVEFARTSRVVLTAPLPEGATSITFGWTGDLGPVVVRQMGVEDGYTAFLTGGALTDPIARDGGSAETAFQAFLTYIGVGFDHIIPLGLDHILFVLGLFFLSLRMGALLWQITAFTLAHTVTLALGALQIVNIPGNIVEPIIAASIVYVGIENVLARGLMPWRPVVVFVFGLLHGLGFASVLSDFGLGASHFVPKLIGFNIGVEIGQLAVILAAFLALGWLFSGYDWYKRRIANPVSIAIALIALFWVFERTGVITPDGPFAPFAMITEGGMPVAWGAAIALGLIVVISGLVLAMNDDGPSDIGGFATSFVAFVAMTGAFTAGAYLVMAGLVFAWVVALRVQSAGETAA